MPFVKTKMCNEAKKPIKQRPDNYLQGLSEEEMFGGIAFDEMRHPAPMPRGRMSVPSC